MSAHRSRLCSVGLHSWQTVTGVEPRIRRGELDGYHYVTRQRCRRAHCRYESWQTTGAQPVPASHARARVSR